MGGKGCCEEGQRLFAVAVVCAFGCVYNHSLWRLKLSMCSPPKGMVCFADCNSTLPLQSAVSRDLGSSASPLNRDEAEPKVERQCMESWVWSCYLCSSLHWGRLLGEAFVHPIPPLPTAPSFPGHVSLYRCLLGEAILFLRLNTLLLYR